MSLVAFSQLPDDARLWIFPADRALRAEEQSALGRAVEESLAGWSAHGSPITWAYELIHDQVLLIGVDERKTGLSGCSIDSATRRIRELERALSVSLLDSGRVFFREGDAIAWRTRPEFRRLAESGAVTLSTAVFDTVIPTVGDYRSGRWEVPARDAWHARAFPLRA